MRAIPLSVDKAEDWFREVVKSNTKLSTRTIDSLEVPELKHFDKSAFKKFQKAFKATPQFEHLYIDHNFRLVKTRREAKQRPSYTLAVRVD